MAKLALLSLAGMGALKVTVAAWKSMSALVKYFVMPRRNLIA